MKVVENTDNRLVLLHAPIPLALLVAGMGVLTIAMVALDPQGAGWLARGFAVAFGLALIVIAHVYLPLSHVIFDRPEQVVILAQMRVTGTRLYAYELGRVGGAQVEANWSDGIRSTRLSLRVGDELVPLEKGYGPRDRRAIEAVVNEWLTRPAAAPG